MHTFNVYSTHFFRAFCLLYFGLMIGNVYGGGVKIKIDPSNNGDPIIDTLLGQYQLINLEDEVMFVGEIVFDLSQAPNISKIELKIYPIDEGQYMPSDPSYSTILTPDSIGQSTTVFDPDKIPTQVKFYYDFDGVGFMMYLKVWEDSMVTSLDYYLSENSGINSRTSNPIINHQVLTFFQFGRSVAVGFDLKSNYDYSYQIIGQDGVNYYSGQFHLGETEIPKIKIPGNIFRNKNQFYVVVIKGYNSSNPPLSCWQKLILSRS